ETTMARATPRVRGDHLMYDTGTGEHTIRVESDEWWRWLAAQETTTFRFEDAGGSFTARRERKGTGCYWYAYRKHDGKLRKAYLGRSLELKQARLDSVAALLNEPGSATTPEGGNNPSPNPLLMTKLYLLPARSSLVARPHLVTRLNAGLRQHGLTLISAPAGFGKTTLLSAWQQAHPHTPLCWVSLDTQDNDPARFWTYVIAALHLRHPGIEDQAIALLPSSETSPPAFAPAMLTALINALATMPQDVALVLDDYHVITTPTIHEALGFLLGHLPPRMHLIIISRSEPPLPLAHLRAQGQLTELHAADLRFTDAEVAVFLNQVMGLALSSSEIAALEARTEGWVAGLQLAALAMQGRADRQDFISAFTGSHRYVVEYLAAEVFQRQPAHIQNFLLSTAILERFTGSLCDAVTGHADGRETLAWLEQAHLFLVPLDEQRHWYRYHHLFSEFLRERLQQTCSALIPQLHHRAADWYESQGLLDEAVEHMLTTTDYEGTAHLIERHAEAILKQGAHMTILHWLRALPAEMVRASPLLNLLYAGSVGLIGQLDDAEARLRDIEQVLAVAGLPVAHPERAESAPERHILGLVLAVRIFLASARADVPRTVELVEQMLAWWPREEMFVRSMVIVSLGQAYMLSGDLATANRIFLENRAISQASDNTYVLLTCICASAFAQSFQGHLLRAAEIYKQALHLGRQRSGTLAPGVSIAYTGLGLLFYDWNRLDEAESHLRLGIEIGQQWGYMAMLAQAYTYLACTLSARGDIPAAFETLEQAEQLTRQHNVATAIDSVLASRARLWLALGNIEAAGEWLQTCGLSAADPTHYLREFGHLTLVRILIAQGHYEDAQTFLARLLQAAESEQRIRGAIEILVLQAILSHKRGSPVQALETLTRALALAEPEGYIRVFVDEGRSVIDLLCHALSCGIAPGYTRKLLAALEVPEAGESLENTPLSEREMRVLKSIAAGQSNQQIAADLTVALSTVKTHINNIYGKLNVHSRTQAVARARDLDLIS
ncbi:MAG: LuxR C-terminal-related transcriptional regulator, partial [Chloroflexota bacterium]|nr:LuxR C-terminal-related transcriptional regulator [Chloroflexota bacterium]